MFESSINMNILNYKIIDLIKNNNMYGGNDNSNDNSNCIIMIIGIIIIIIGFVLIYFKNNWIEVEAIIQNKSCDNKNNECKINITYIINSIQYSKIITMAKTDSLNDSIIKIYYQESNPNIIQLYNLNYSIIGISLVIFGSFIFILSNYTSNITEPIYNTSNIETNLYTDTINTDGMNIVYTK
jgi:uncharacterized membrane protein